MVQGFVPDAQTTDCRLEVNSPLEAVSFEEAESRTLIRKIPEDEP